MKTEEQKDNAFRDPVSDWASCIMNAVLTGADKAASTLPPGYTFEGVNASFQKNNKVVIGYVFGKGAVR